MTYYKELLLKKLADAGWELQDIDSETEWWATEIWRIKSTREAWGKAVFVIFMVDPQYDGDSQNADVWAVMASETIPSGRPGSSGAICEVSLVRGKLDANIAMFVNDLDEYRRTIE